MALQLTQGDMPCQCLQWFDSLSIQKKLTAEKAPAITNCLQLPVITSSYRSVIDLYIQNQLINLGGPFLKEYTLAIECCSKMVVCPNVIARANCCGHFTRVVFCLGPPQICGNLAFFNRCSADILMMFPMPFLSYEFPCVWLF